MFSWDSFPVEGAKLLELGCGDGFVTVRLASMGLRITGIDCSGVAVQRAHENLTNAGLSADLHIGDACDLAFLNQESFPFILDSRCLHCITEYADRSLFLSQCHRVLTSGGRLFLATMGEQSMEWTRTLELSTWQKEREITYDVDEKGCYFQSLVPPGTSERFNSRIFIHEEVLREEITTAGFEIIRFEQFAPENDPGDISFLVELQRLVQPCV
jgi:2-polyprenyl-3-methyl-5-hydroxy-6-metoxy-1,4-benzoquinol methylase